MKKWLLIVGLLLAIDVYASPSIELECKTTYINEESSCNIILNDNTDVQKVSFVLDESVRLSSNLTVERNNNKYTIYDINRNNIIGTIKFSTDLKTYDINIKKILFEGETNYSQEDLKKEINVLEKTSNYLKSISVDNNEVENFSKNVNDYDVKVQNKIVEITAVQEDSNSMVVGTGFKTFDVGQNRIVITVIDANDLKNEYVLNITYELPKNNDNKLKKLELYNGNQKINLSFEKSIANYDLTVGDKVSVLTIKAQLNDEKAQFVNGYGERDVELKYGENTIEVKTKAENGDEKVYQILVVRSDARKWDDTLKKLIVNDQEIHLKAGIYNYNVDVRYNVNRSKISAIPSDNNVKVEYEDIDLVTGINEVSISLISNDNEVREYKIKINKLTEDESKYILESIAIVNNEFQFDSEKTNYDIHVDEPQSSLDFVILPKEGIDYEILNNSDLKDKSTVIVNIRDDLGSKSYVFNISKDHDSMVLNAICYSTFVIGLLSFICSILRYRIKFH